MHKKIILSLGLSSYLLCADSFAQIKFDGLTQISFNVAKEIINLKDQNSYTTKEIDRSIKELYKYGYFTDIWVTNDNNILTIDISAIPILI